MKDIILLGGGGHCKSVIDTIKELNKFNIAGILDVKDKVGTKVDNVEIIGIDEDLNYYYNQGIELAFITAGSIENTALRRNLYQKAINIGYKFPYLIDPTVITSKNIKIGQGTFVGKGATINSDANLGMHCIINTGVIIEHDCNIGEFCHIAPGSTLSGGVNHNGSVELAKQLIDKASEAGADAVKFQSFKAEKLVTKGAKKAEYQEVATGNIDSQFNMLKRLELDYDKHDELIQHAKSKGIMFLSSPFDLESIDLLDRLGLEIFKIPSGEINNLPYLRKLGNLNKKIILSTGMATLSEIEAALDILRGNGTSDIIVLHCNTEYPTPIEDVNLMAMNTIKNAFKVEIGYSDHTLGIEVPIAAVALGASVIEKHFTLDNTMEGPDHRASLEPDELKKMVDAIRNIEKALGNGVKKPSNSDKKNKDMARKSIVAQLVIKKGEMFTEDNLDIKRPGNGISPIRWDEVIGKVAKIDFKEDELIEL